MFRGDPGLSGRASSVLPARLKRLWTFDAGAGIESTAAIVNGVVYVGSLDGSLYAIGLDDGETVLLRPPLHGRAHLMRTRV